MNYLKLSIIISSLFLTQLSYGQQDTTNLVSSFSGSVGITNNGFSIIPTFSLNSPAAIMNFTWKKKRFSFNPDIRLVTDASKGGFIFWLRYQAIQAKKFGLRVSAHPALSLVRKTIIDNGSSIEITEMLRFLAYEIVPSYQITPNWNVSAVYLQGHGLQNHGPQLTRAFFVNTSISDIKIGGDFRFQITPSYYYLYTDSYTGNYLAVTAGISKKGSPFAIQSTINQTFDSNIPNNKDFMWNAMLSYNFSRNLKRI
ncbi:hypothetical protein LV89_01566 [Arcicella aurantiaca]|uniref:DUF2490 domain-containing protein n=1 Tax=Arcicella aurantiaca TaxID=591202 RepID=A0A316EB59_9BACT|nr:hypothetical protein [Arcicella aurantiaca]PWK27675.1 hypothetical protein LV89_01566 [Arcicella aurantiaca]